MGFTIQYISDIHLEMHDKDNEGYIIPSMFLKPSAPYLALCGDIGIPGLNAYEAFLSWCSKSWKHVFLIAGNHEFYNYRTPQKADIPTRIQLIEQIVSKYPNVHFLNNSSYMLEADNLRILGTTLWSDTSSGDERQMLLYMNDFRSIFLKDAENLHPYDVYDMYIKNREWLSKEIQDAKERGEEVLVLTHHLPTEKLIHEKYKSHPLNMCFASNCEELIQVPVKGWICGHSHTGVRLELNGVKCVMNPYGYPGEKSETRNREAVLSFGIKDEVLDI